MASPALAESLHAADAPTPAWPGTRPIAAAPAIQARDNYADLLTPVRYGQDRGLPGSAQSMSAQPGMLAPGAPPPGSAPYRPGQPGSAPVGSPAREHASPGQAGPARWLLVLATLAALVAVSVLLPIAGAAFALAVLVLLRATDATNRWMGRRRSRQGPRRSDAASATALFPLAVGRSVLSSVLLAPIALLFAAIAAVLAVLATGPAQLPKVGSYAAGALVACYCIGPGSRACRRPLSNFYGKVTSSAPAAIIGTLAVGALALAMIVAAATLAPGYWPDVHLGNQLQNATVAHPGVNRLSADISSVSRYIVRVIRHNLF
jgi:hypothetical protein